MDLGKRYLVLILSLMIIQIIRHKITLYSYLKECSAKRLLAVGVLRRFITKMFC